MIAKKQISVTLSYEGVTSMLACYGYSATSNYKKNYVDFLSNEIVSFLKECGVSSAKYEDTFIWVNGLPISLRITSSSSGNAFFVVPFINTSLGTTTILPSSVNHSNVAIVFYFAGNETSFVFTVAQNSNCLNVWFANGKNVARGTKAVGVGGYAATSLTYGTLNSIYPYDFDSSGNIEAFGGDGAQATKNEILKLTSSSFAADFTRYGKFPLRHQFLSFFEFDSYINPQNSGYAAIAAPNGNHTVLEMDGEKYVLLPLLDFVKM